MPNPVAAALASVALGPEVVVGMAHARRAQARGGRSAILVRGGPGTGKTVIAVQLLADAPALWELDAYPAFLEWRREHLAAELNRLLGLEQPA